MLQQQSATIAVTPPALAVEDDTLTVQVRVTNLAGHKLPTGYPEGRRMWIHLEATDALGAVFFESGAYEDSSATLVKDSQLRIYETEHGVHGQGPGFHLVLNNRIYTDTRIPPRGFRPVTGTEPLGIDYPVQPDGSLAYWDDASFDVPVPIGVQGPVQVRATLRYQTASRDYVEFLRDENTSGPDPTDRNYPAAPDRGTKMHGFWMTYGKSAPVDMVSDQVAVPVTVAPPNVSTLEAVSGHNRVALSWDLPVEAAGVKILRRGWGGYPDYGSAPAGLPEPLIHEKLSQALASGWTVVYDGPGTSFEDGAFDDGSRDIAFYAAYAYDASGVHARMTPEAQVRAASYLVGDLADVGVPGVYDGAIDGIHDLPAFSLAYASVAGGGGWNAEADFAPTHDGTREGIPMPDDRVDFKDLLIFSLQFGRIDGVTARGLPLASVGETGPLRLSVGQPRAEGDLWRIPLHVSGASGRMRALHVELDAEFSPQALLAFEPGSVVRGATHPFFVGVDRNTDGAGADLALLGPAAVLGADGHLGDLIVRAATRPDPVREARAHGAAGEPLVLELERSGAEPPRRGSALVALAPNVPNPFNPRTRIDLRLERESEVEVAVYDLAGRRIATLARELLAAGVHPLIWTGTDDAGDAVASGVYLVRATALGDIAVRRVVLVR
jgi:hypothetical protein